MAIRNFIRRRKGILLTLCIVAVTGYIGANLVAYSLTYKSEACLTCHIMQPYYNNWKASTHNKVGCIECHPYRPSTIVMSSFRYLTGTYALPLKTKVEDKECILCHKPDAIKIVSYRGMPFNHLEHVSKEKRGRMLHCSSCHYSVVQSNAHVTVDPNVCTLCHFNGTSPQYNRNCTVCHGNERKGVKIGEVVFSHSSFLKTGARCIECHSQTVSGQADVPEGRCMECHIERKVEGRDAERLHMVHVSDNYVKCSACHNKLEHGKETVRFSHAIELSCSECHSSTHGSAKDMYMGMGSATVKDAPSPMYVSRVRCTGCHATEKSMEGKDLLARGWESKKKSCVLCHKSGYDRMAEDWKKGMAAFSGDLAKMVGNYKALLEKGKGTEGLQKKYRAMEQELELLRDGRGEHNIRYAFEIGKNIALGVQQGYKAMNITDKPVLPAALKNPDGLCLFCHATFLPDNDIPIKAMKGLKFSHALHTSMDDMSCTKCHNAATHRLGGGYNEKACSQCHQK